MKISIHQTTFLPYLGTWAKIADSDVFIIETNYIFSTTSFYYRTHVTNKKGELEYLTLPITREPVHLSETQLKDVNEAEKRIRKALSYYVDAPYYKDVMVKMEIFFKEQLPSCKTLHNVNMDLFWWVYNWLGLTTKVVVVGPGDVEETPDDTKTSRLIRKINIFGNKHNVYISGGGGRDYLDVAEMNKNGIDVVFQSATGDFYKGSILHYMMNYKPEEVKEMISNSFSYLDK